VLDRQKLANLFTMFITRQLSDKWLNDVELDPITNLPAVWNNDGNMTVGLEPGTAFELKPGEDVKFANPPEAGTTYSDYFRTLGLGTASGADMPYELFSGDIKDISDRALRVVINEYRRFAAQRQWQIIIPMMAQPMVEWWAEAMLLSGRMGPALATAARRPQHSPHGWEYIHPVQDIEGKIKAIEAGITSRDAVIGSHGDDPRQVDREAAEGDKRRRQMSEQQE
jgi:capsid protein